MEDTDDARNPADHQRQNPIVHGLWFSPPLGVLIKPAQQVDSLKDVRHRVPDTYQNVDEDNFKDDKSSEFSDVFFIVRLETNFRHHVAFCCPLSTHDIFEFYVPSVWNTVYGCKGCGGNLQELSTSILLWVLVLRKSGSK